MDEAQDSWGVKWFLIGASAYVLGFPLLLVLLGLILGQAVGAEFSPVANEAIAHYKAVLTAVLAGTGLCVGLWMVLLYAALTSRPRRRGLLLCAAASLALLVLAFVIAFRNIPV